MLPSQIDIPSYINIKVPTSYPEQEQLPFDNSDESSVSSQSRCIFEPEENVTETLNDCWHTIDRHSMEQNTFLTNTENTEIALLQFCEKINAPLYAYDELMTILSLCSITSDTFSTDFTRRKALVSKLKKAYDMEDTQPKDVRVKLEGGRQVTVVTCPFLPMLRSLLNDPRCVQDENFTFQNNNPCSKPVETGICDELHTVSWYRQT